MLPSAPWSLSARSGTLPAREGGVHWGYEAYWNGDLSKKLSTHRDTSWHGLFIYGSSAWHRGWKEGPRTLWNHAIGGKSALFWILLCARNDNDAHPDVAWFSSFRGARFPEDKCEYAREKMTFFLNDFSTREMLSVSIKQKQKHWEFDANHNED